MVVVLVRSNSPISGRMRWLKLTYSFGHCSAITRPATRLVIGRFVTVQKDDGHGFNTSIEQHACGLPQRRVIKRDQRIAMSVHSFRNLQTMFPRDQRLKAAGQPIIERPCPAA